MYLFHVVRKVVVVKSHKLDNALGSNGLNVVVCAFVAVFNDLYEQNSIVLREVLLCVLHRSVKSSDCNMHHVLILQILIDAVHDCTEDQVFI